ncbi:hypothetical protein BH10CHL1_BH10CHL1_13870 [soil metagenome]
MDVRLRSTQKSFKDRVKRARKVGRKAFLVYAGLLGLTYDKVKSVLKDSKILVEEAEQRGETMTQDVGGRVEMLRQQANVTVKDLRTHGVQSAAKLNKKAKVVQTEVEAAIANMETEGGPSPEVATPTMPAAAISELAPIEPLTGNHAITADKELNQPTILIASASSDLSELLASAVPSTEQAISTQAESAAPTILIANASGEVSAADPSEALAGSEVSSTPEGSDQPTL